MMKPTFYAQSANGKPVEVDFEELTQDEAYGFICILTDKYYAQLEQHKRALEVVHANYKDEIADMKKSARNHEIGTFLAGSIAMVVLFLVGGIIQMVM